MVEVMASGSGSAWKFRRLLCETPRAILQLDEGTDEVNVTCQKILVDGQSPNITCRAISIVRRRGSSE
jgi:hypothetical protein